MDYHYEIKINKNDAYENMISTFSIKNALNENHSRIKKHLKIALQISVNVFASFSF